MDGKDLLSALRVWEIKKTKMNIKKTLVGLIRFVMIKKNTNSGDSFQALNRII